MDFKPLSVQFNVDDEQLVDRLIELARMVGKQRGDRRLGAGAVAKEIVLKVLHSGDAERLLGLLSAEQVQTKPKKK